MTERDTVGLLKTLRVEAKQGERALRRGLAGARDPELRRFLACSLEEYTGVAETASALLNAYGERQPPPGPAAALRPLRDAAVYAARPGDSTVASLMTDRCTASIKSVSRELNRYGNASRPASEAAGTLIRCQTQLSERLRSFL